MRGYPFALPCGWTWDLDVQLYNKAAVTAAENRVSQHAEKLIGLGFGGRPPALTFFFLRLTKSKDNKPPKFLLSHAQQNREEWWPVAFLCQRYKAPFCWIFLALDKIMAIDLCTVNKHWLYDKCQYCAVLRCWYGRHFVFCFYDVGTHCICLGQKWWTRVVYCDRHDVLLFYNPPEVNSSGGSGGAYFPPGSCQAIVAMSANNDGHNLKAQEIQERGIGYFTLGPPTREQMLLGCYGTLIYSEFTAGSVRTYRHDRTTSSIHSQRGNFREAKKMS
jgi:hypothetical protein